VELGLLLLLLLLLLGLASPPVRGPSEAYTQYMRHIMWAKAGMELLGLWPTLRCIAYLPSHTMLTGWGAVAGVISASSCCCCSAAAAAGGAGAAPAAAAARPAVAAAAAAGARAAIVINGEELAPAIRLGAACVEAKEQRWHS
jgi:hypothetical protein